MFTTISHSTLILRSISGLVVKSIVAMRYSMGPAFDSRLMQLFCEKFPFQPSISGLVVKSIVAMQHSMGPAFDSRLMHFCVVCLVRSYSSLDFLVLVSFSAYRGSLGVVYLS